MNILLLNDNTEHKNWGAQATPFALRHILTKRVPECEIRALSWSWIRLRPRIPKGGLMESLEFRESPIPRLRFLFVRCTREKEIYPRVRDDFDWFAKQWSSGGWSPIADEYLELVRWADVVVYNGENNLYRNTLEGCRSIFLLYLTQKWFGKPACGINHTIHITDVQPIMKSMIQTVYPTLSVVTSREIRSFRAFQELGVSNVKSSADVVFTLRETEQARKRVDQWLEATGLTGKPFACLSASGLPVSRPREGYDGAISELVTRLQYILGMPVVILTKDPPCRFMMEVAKRTKSPCFGPEHHFSELWPLLRNASVLISGHYHYVIIAAISGCPFVPLSVVNHKMAGLCEQLGWQRVEPYDITCLRPIIDNICIEAGDLVGQGKHLRRKLKYRAVELGKLAMATGDWVKKSAENWMKVNSKVGEL